VITSEAIQTCLNAAWTLEDNLSYLMTKRDNLSHDQMRHLRTAIKHKNSVLVALRNIKEMESSSEQAANT